MSRPDGRSLSLGELLELLYGARDRFSTIHALVRRWLDPALASEAWTNWAAQQPPGSVSQLTPVGVPTRVSEERVFELWGMKPGRWRYEVRSGSQAGWQRIIDGTRVWVKVPGESVRFRTEPRQIQPTSIAEDLTMLDPAWLIPVLSLEVVGRTVVAEREAIRVKALPRDTTGPTFRKLDEFDQVVWPGADEYELLVDSIQGALLRYSARLEGKEFAGAEMLSAVQ